MTSQPIIEYFANQSSNLTSLHTFCSNKCNVWHLLLATKVIELNCPCPRCETSTNVLHNTCENYFNLNRFCPKCRIHFSLYHHTILTRAHIDPPTFLALAYCWVNNYNLDAACSECSVNKNTVTNFYTAFRDSVIEELTDGEQPQIGGKGLDVEIDETVISHRKYHKGRILSTVWVFGGICRQTKEAFAIVVPDRTAPTLTREIADHIAPGSIIHSDSWASYKQIEAIPDKNFTHYSVNHSKNFIDPETGSHTQGIERLWRDLKVKKLLRVGYVRKNRVVMSLNISGDVII